MAAALTLGGGIAAMAACFLEWLRFTEVDGGGLEYQGIDLDLVEPVVGLGLGLVVVGVVLFVNGRRTGGRGASVWAIALGSVVVGVALSVILFPVDSFIRAAASTVGLGADMSTEDATHLIEHGVYTGQADVGARAGAWLGAAGGAVALLGGITGLATGRRLKRPAEP